MKKLFALILALLMLCACGVQEEQQGEIIIDKEPISEISEESSKPEEITNDFSSSEETPEEKYNAKNVEKYEAENFFYSDEGYEDMAFFASWLGTKSFENAEDFVDYGCLNFFAKELYEIVGEDALDEEEIFFHVPEKLGNKYFIKYFGVDYSPNEDNVLFDTETNCYKIATAGGGAPFKLVSFSHPSNIEENRFSVEMLILMTQDELGSHYAYSEMVFDVMEDEDGKFLRLVSNNLIEHFEESALTMQAHSLTNQIVQLIGKKAFTENSFEVTEEMAGYFAVRAALFTNASKGFDKNSPYVGSFSKTSGYLYRLPVLEMERIVYEVFGVEKLNYDFNSNFEYDSENNEYLTGFDWGMEHNAEAKDMTTYVDGNIYFVEFTLRYIGTNSEGDPEWMDGEKYTMKFERIDGEFLRYIGLEKI